VPDTQRRWRNESGTPPPTRVTVTKIRDKFGVDGTGRNVDKGRSGRPRSSTHDVSVATVLQACTQSRTHASKPRTLQDLRRETETLCAAVPLATIQDVCLSIARHYQQSMPLFH
jgi:hypothetical protein